jgi:hypothetical protein
LKTRACGKRRCLGSWSEEKHSATALAGRQSTSPVSPHGAGPAFSPQRKGPPGATGGPKPQTGFRGKGDVGFLPCLASPPTKCGLARGERAQAGRTQLTFCWGKASTEIVLEDRSLSFTRARSSVSLATVTIAFERTLNSFKDGNWSHRQRAICKFTFIELFLELVSRSRP